MGFISDSVKPIQACLHMVIGCLFVCLFGVEYIVLWGRIYRRTLSFPRYMYGRFFNFYLRSHPVSAGLWHLITLKVQTKVVDFYENYSSCDQSLYESTYRKWYIAFQVTRREIILNYRYIEYLWRIWLNKVRWCKSSHYLNAFHIMGGGGIMQLVLQRHIHE